MRVHWNRVVAVTALVGIVSLVTAVPAVAAPRPDNGKNSDTAAFRGGDSVRAWNSNTQLG